MKKFMFIVCILGILVPGIAQNRAVSSKEKREMGIIIDKSKPQTTPIAKKDYPIFKSTQFYSEEEQIGNTVTDNQANGSTDNRVYLYEDGTIVATWIRGISSSLFPDRGTGYNYFDGNTWDDWPEERIETQWCGWPSYAPLGENGEMVVSHTYGSDLLIYTRQNIGIGDWSYSVFEGPAGCPPLVWNNTITSGTDHNRIHLLVCSWPDQYYQGMYGSILYSKSTDGGLTWDIENVILDGMTSNEYWALSGDIMMWAQPRGDTLAFVVGTESSDMFLMKSTDGGKYFNKTIIWNNPYTFLHFGMTTDTFYSVDAAHSVALDTNGMVHVAFGINRSLYQPEYAIGFPWVDGIGYWNENMPAFSDDLNALSPYGEPGSEMIEDYNLIGWSQDVNGNGQLDFLDNIALYYRGLSSMPQLIIDEQNHLYLIYSSITETYDNGIKNYRHLWSRKSIDGGNTWSSFHDLTSGINYYFTECAYPACAKNSDEYIYMLYQADDLPGAAVWWQHPFHENKIMFMKVLKDEITFEKEPQPFILNEDVSQNYPNPFNDYSYINVNLRKACHLQLVVNDMIGKIVYEANMGYLASGLNKVSINGINLSPGIYFYTVKAGNVEVTKKMIIK